MTSHLWIGFALAAALIGLVPGPGVMGIVGYAVTAGRRVALASTAVTTYASWLGPRRRQARPRRQRPR